MREALQSVGAPVDLIQIVEEPTMEASSLIMSMTDACISTGGPGMVKAAYGSGKPAYGVGAGNVQCFVDRDVALEEVVPKIVRGRTYDNGVLCTCEQCVLCPREKADEMIAMFKAQGAFYISEPEALDAFRKQTFPDGMINKDFVGKTAIEIGQLAGLPVTADTKLILVKAEGYGANEYFTKEKLCPILTFCVYDTWEEAVEMAKANLEIEGKGHSCVIHSNTKAHVEYVAENVSVSRFSVNQIGSSSLGGTLSNGLNPTATLGCGTWGNNSISENLWFTHLINISRIAYEIPDAPVLTDEEIWEL
jgi:succinate-semialdehyde dehydrogenase